MELPGARYRLEDIKTVNSRMREIKRLVRRIAKSDASVLIIGESGVGKELIASAIHNESGRTGEFVAINCAAIPENLWESEFFGYEGGAFTGASVKGKPGIIELAHGGTLFLDEVSEIPLHLQAKLLRILQEKEFMRVGGRARRAVDIRVIAATNRDLGRMVEEGKFRRDLYHRLNVIPIYVPPLRERPDDIIYLAEYFLRVYAHKTGKKFAGFSTRVKEFFLHYHWPGNVRELENAIECAVNIEENVRIGLDSLPYNLKMLAKSCEKKGGSEVYNSCDDLEEKLKILKLLAKYGWSVEGKRKAAREMGISLATFYRRLKCYNL